MRELSLIELFHLTRIELLDLHAKISKQLPDHPEGSEDRRIAGRNLCTIRLVLDLRRSHGIGLSLG